ncbi:hypothetical protein VHUM_00094 [Vanrija humicola]|uniref:DUF1479 domain protein n=1 Tax=Vanrija humicola TaxID=5417 RepID=A0A7D8VB00_VANHU|nr:hypothetical protein VHUM_00094 [Vanrija humicola]
MAGRRKPRAEGDIGSVFASLSGEEAAVLPPRFRDLKTQIINDADRAALTASWGRLTERLAQAAEEIETAQQDAVPTVAYDDLINADAATVQRIKRAGALVLTDVVSRAEAEGWLADVEAYVKANPQVKGFPADDKQVFEVYWSKPQLEARAHPRSVAAQRALLSLFASAPGSPVSLDAPLTYADRLRIRHPGDSRFALGPHMDGGSIERWEDPTYRSVYAAILSGNWEAFDAFEIAARSAANQNLYDGAGACGIFRAFQGWTSLSDTGPGEGTLRVYPLIREQTAYTLLRPLFREVKSKAEVGHEAYLAPQNWVLDTETTEFPGAPPARSQEFNDDTHPHLQLSRSMVSIPRVRPGDQAWWHADTIHAVESAHRGTGPSAVMYIPAVPLTRVNAAYVRDQLDSLRGGVPPPDFPGGEGEQNFRGRATERDVPGDTARQAMGIEPFEVAKGMPAGERAARQEANAIFGFA